jgi:hypothetical protein
LAKISWRVSNSGKGATRNPFALGCFYDNNIKKNIDQKRVLSCSYFDVAFPDIIRGSGDILLVVPPKATTLSDRAHDPILFLQLRTSLCSKSLMDNMAGDNTYDCKARLQLAHPEVTLEMLIEVCSSGPPSLFAEAVVGSLASSLSLEKFLDHEAVLNSIPMGAGLAGGIGGHVVMMRR